MIDKIVGFITLPVSIIIFLNLFGVLSLNSIIGLDIVLIAAIAHVINQVADVIGAHISDEYVVLSYFAHGILLFPSILFFLSKIITMPAAVVEAFPVMLASFIFVEGIFSFFI